MPPSGPNARAPHLVEDLPRRLRGRDVVDRPLPAGQGAQRPAGEVGPERQGEAGGPERVPAEQREVPRGPGPGEDVVGSERVAHRRCRRSSRAASTVPAEPGILRDRRGCRRVLLRRSRTRCRRGWAPCGRPGRPRRGRPRRRRAPPRPRRAARPRRRRSSSRLAVDEDDVTVVAPRGARRPGRHRGAGGLRDTVLDVVQLRAVAGDPELDPGAHALAPPVADRDGLAQPAVVQHPSPGDLHRRVGPGVTQVARHGVGLGGRRRCSRRRPRWARGRRG